MFEIAKVAFHPLRLYLLTEQLPSVDDSACWRLFAGQSANCVMLFFRNFFITQFTALRQAVGFDRPHIHTLQAEYRWL